MIFTQRTLFSQVCTIIAAIGLLIIGTILMAEAVLWGETHHTAAAWLLGFIWGFACIIHCFARIRIFGGAPQ